MWKDGWTATTKDGRRSAQFEHTLLVTPTGVEAFTGRLPTSNPFFWDTEDYTLPALGVLAPASGKDVKEKTTSKQKPTKGFSGASRPSAKKTSGSKKKKRK